MIKFVFLLVFFSCSKTLDKDGMRALTASANGFRAVEYIGNFDGDTITVNLPNSIPDVLGKNIPVRIRHIDAPELHSKDKCEQKAAVEARGILQGILKNAKQIDLEDVGRDKYFRLLADVIADGKQVGKILLDKGYAIPYEGETKSKVGWCRTSQIKK